MEEKNILTLLCVNAALYILNMICDVRGMVPAVFKWRRLAAEINVYSTETANVLFKGVKVIRALISPG